MPRFTINVERKMVETVEIIVVVDTEDQAYDKARSIADRGKGVVTHRECDPDATYIFSVKEIK